MKDLLLILTGVAALVTTGAAMNPSGAAYNVRKAVTNQEQHDDSLKAAEETITIRRRECDIACPSDRAFCYYPPHNYKCDRNGKLQWDERDMDCEQPTRGCWCGCDWRAPGIEKKDITGF